MTVLNNEVAVLTRSPRGGVPLYLTKKRCTIFSRLDRKKKTNFVLDSKKKFRTIATK